MLRIFNKGALFFFALLTIGAFFFFTDIFVEADTKSSPENMSDRNSLIKKETRNLLFENKVNRENLLTRYDAYRTNDAETIQKLQDSGDRFGKIRILIVPGHDDEYSGAVFNQVKEKNLTVKVAAELKKFLETDPSFEIYITRDENGYTDYLKKYLDEHIEEVLNLMKLYKEKTTELESEKEIEPIKQVFHINAPGETKYRLYAFNKWVEDNEIDIVLHIHFNDYAGRSKWAGKYSGFSIYIPDNGLRNGKQSKEMADFIRDNLNNIFAESDAEGESEIVIPDHELIAVGANNTLQAISALIEYGYIYEPQFLISPVNQLIFREAAYQTFLGLREYFTGIPFSKFGASTLLKRNLQTGILFGQKNDEKVLALQSVLAILGYYPPIKYSLNNCPIGGTFGNCTLLAVKRFQKENKIDATGIVGEKTIEILNQKILEMF